MKGYGKYIIVLALTLALALFAEASAPKAIDWSPSYSRYHKIPYGAFALYEMFVETLPAGSVQTSDLPLYNTIETSDNWAVDNYLIVNETFEPDEYDREEILDFVARGNTAFIAASSIGFAFQDSLGFATSGRSLFLPENLDMFLQQDTVRMNFVNPGLIADSSYPIRVGNDEHWITTLDRDRTTILGEDENHQTNFVRIDHGEGSFYISTLPRAFTNVNVVSGRNREYAFKALSYLPPGKTVWDEYYKAGRRVSSSPFRFVLGNPSLRWAMVTALVGVMLFVFVHSRRRQRAIPVVKPPTNSTLEFTETVGRLYFEHGDHRGIATKKVAYFHEYLRSHLGIKITDVEHELYRRISERSGVAESLVRTIYGRIHHMRRAESFDADDLKSFNADLEMFYAHSKR
ncbi:MAG: DUF4350 domain-containing protein [bacterium]|nr:DUF4350 domain-containing protein [Candidatus Kapabacteria bacterium]